MPGPENSPIATGGLPATIPLDLADALGSIGIAVLFLKSRAEMFPMALGAAMNAAIFREIAAGRGATAYLAGFGDGEDQARRALILMDYVGKWKGTQAFIHGRPVAWNSSVRETLHCYLKSFLHEIPDDYCVQLHRLGGFSVSVIQIRMPGEIPVEPPPPPKQKILVLPCRRSSYYRWHSIVGGPSLKAQMIADAIDYEFRWCPRFNPDRFEETIEA